MQLIESKCSYFYKNLILQESNYKTILLKYLKI